MRFEDKLAAAQQRNRSWLCVGLDIVAGKLPLSVQQTDDPLLTFARAIVDATQDLVCAFKPNLGFFLAEGAAGIIALERLARYIPRDIPIILDGKFSDIGSTAGQYARGAFQALGVDAVTLSPYVGADAIQPFLAFADKGVFVLARTSNPGAGQFQNLMVERESQGVADALLHAPHSTLYEAVVREATQWHRQGPGRAVSSSAQRTHTSWSASACLRQTCPSSCRALAHRAATWRQQSGMAPHPAASVRSSTPAAASCIRPAGRILPRRPGLWRFRCARR